MTSYPALRLSCTHLAEALARAIRLSIDGDEASKAASILAASLSWLRFVETDPDLKRAVGDKVARDRTVDTEDAYENLTYLIGVFSPCPANGPDCSGCPDCSDEFGTPDAPEWPCRAESHPDGLWGCTCPECRRLQRSAREEAGR